MIGCRGEFDIDQYLVGDDVASTSESGSTSNTSSESGSSDVTGESESSTTAVDTTESSSESSTTDVECLEDEVDLGARCLSVVYTIDLGPNVPTDLELVDVDNNRSLDVVLAGAQVGFRLNMGVGDFGPAQFITGPSAASIAVGDFDGDGQPDLATFPEMGVYFYLNSNNAFVYDSMLSLNAADGVFVAIDGNPGDDLVLSGTSVRVVISAGGSFSIGDDLLFTGNALGLVSLNDDARKDVILATPASSIVAFTNDGQTLTMATEHVLGMSISAIAALDIQKDGTKEVLMTATDGRLYVYAPDDLDSSLDSALVGGGPSAIATGDLDGDGYDDVVVANANSHDIAVLLNSGTALGDGILIPTGDPNDEPESIGVGDLDNDNLSDIVVGVAGTNRLVVLR